ncbi:MAG: hypothetical protein LBE36_09115 [Flavobacteriaceae bacterium]|nr:hypothetical protein [Flavobacteriaceae bacterium]
MKKTHNLLIFIILLIIFKSLFFLTKHIQEDAFITWRVAKNIVDFGVYGFNGDVKISASTTHLYVLISVIFRLLFSDNFIYPLLIFNSILFTFGTKHIADLLLNSDKSKIWFILFINFLPPALKISTIGMEFGMLFFFYACFLKYAMVKRKTWAFFIFPILISWTRLDSALFLSVAFIYDFIKHKKPNYVFIFSGIVSAASLIGFNYFYFGEIVNNTITAKKIAYEEDKTLADHFIKMIYNTNFYSMVKIPKTIARINLFFILSVALSIFAFFKIKHVLSKIQFFILCTIYTYAWSRIFIFGFANSWFDWYYWIPQIFMFVPVILWFTEKITLQKTLIYILLFCLPMTLYQTVHSIASGNGNWNYSRKVGMYIDSLEPNKNKTIYLEAAGYISYFSKLKVIDYVGLVDKRVTEEFKKDPKNVDENILKSLKPDYILDFDHPMFNGRIDSATQNQYQLIKTFRISDVAQSNNGMLDKTYKLKPSGKDYYLYKRIKN